jgi:chromosome segregation ATPase
MMCLLACKELLTMLKSPKKELPKAEDDAKKRRKKLAKREAELMLKVDLAKKDLRKAEERLTRARAGLETAQSALQNTELELAELRVPASADSGEEVEDENGDRDRGEPPDMEQVVGAPPAEGRVDISDPSGTSEASGEDANSTK